MTGAHSPLQNALAEFPAPETSELSAEVIKLAAMPALEYDRLRKSEAERLGVRVATLDDAVNAARPAPDHASPAAGGGRVLSLPDTEPWSEPVDGAAVLAEASELFTRYIALPAGAADALALWCAYTHAFDAFFISPRLAIISPEKRCGKTTVLRALALLCNRALPAANITAPALFRTIELARPTLLVDEADTFLKGSEELRGVLNSGHARDGCVIRTVGDDHEPRQFSTWAPCAIAMIGRLPDTLADRSIAVPMRRRTASEQTERLRSDRTEQAAGLRSRLARFAVDARGAWGRADPAMPAGLHDRAADNWRPLFAIADAAGGGWRDRAAAACLALSAGAEPDADSTGVALLRDIRTAFAAKGDPDRLASADLCHMLADNEASLWAAYGRSEKPLAPVALARLLKRFKIAPKFMRDGADTWRGYERDAFADAWARYLPAETPSRPATPLQALKTKGRSAEVTRYTPDAVSPPNPPQSLAGQELYHCSGSQGAAEGDETSEAAGMVEESL